MRESHGALRPSTGRRFFAARLTGAALQRRKHHVPVCEAHGRNMIAEAACSRSCLSKKAGAAGLFRQDTFPLRLGARPGKRAGKPCCARFPNPPHMSPGSDCIWRASALQASPKGFVAADGTGRGLPPLPASPQKCVPFVDTLRPPRRSCPRQPGGADSRSPPSAHPAGRSGPALFRPRGDYGAYR